MVPRVGNMLSRAFHDDVILAHHFPKPGKRLRIGRIFFQFPIYPALELGEAVVTSPELEGVAV